MTIKTVICEIFGITDPKIEDHKLDIKVEKVESEYTMYLISINGKPVEGEFTADSIIIILMRFMQLKEPVV